MGDGRWVPWLISMSTLPWRPVALPGREEVHSRCAGRGAAMELNSYIEQKHDEHLNDLYEILRIPSVSAQSQHKPDIERAAQWVAERLRRAGLGKVEIVPTKMHPLVYAESLNAPGKPTVL